MNGAPESQTAASASPLVGPYPIDEDALRKLKRLHDDGAIDAHEFKRRKAEALGLREGSLAWACLKGRARHAVSLAAPTPRQTFPVRPELFKFTDPRSVCQLNGTSKTLQIDLQGTKAWARLAEAQLPPPTPRDDNEALARVRPHWRRRLLAKASPPTRRVLEGVTLLEALSRPAPAPVAYTPNELSDFTFFLRLTDGAGELIWEGDLRDLRRQPDGEGIDWQLSLRHVDLQLSGRVDRIALVAIRDADQAMVSLGHFDREGGPGTFEGELWYNFYPSSSPSRPLFSSGRSQLVFFAALYFAQEADVFRPERLELTLHHVVHPPCLDPHRRYLCTDTSDDSYDLGEPQLRHVLSYIAGINPLARAFALDRIERWLIGAERQAGWDNPRAVLTAELAEVEERIGRALEVESDPDYVEPSFGRQSDSLRQDADALRAELDA